MKFLIQRVTKASVTVEEKIVGKIGKGFLVFIGVGTGDSKEKADYLVKKMLNLRIFEDEECKSKREVVEAGIFGEDMKVELINDGPFTIMLEA